MTTTAGTISSLVRRASSLRRQARRLETRDAILRAATELLGESGFDEFSLRKLAARIGYTPTTLYRYFTDKDELVGAVMQEGYAEFTRAMAAAAESTGDPFDQLDALGRAYVEFGLAHEVMYRVLFLQRPELWRRIPPERVEAACGAFAFQLLVSAQQRAIATGRAREQDAEAASLALWALMHGVVSLCLALPHLSEPAARETLVEGALALASLRSTA